MTKRAQQDIARKLKVLKYAQETGNIAKTCRYFGICRQTFYTWQKSFADYGEKGLIDSRPCPENHKLRIPLPIEEKIIHLRTTYHLGPDVIVWQLLRYHGIKISRNGV
jgi:transposase-like protein